MRKGGAVVVFPSLQLPVGELNLEELSAAVISGLVRKGLPFLQRCIIVSLRLLQVSQSGDLWKLLSVVGSSAKSKCVSVAKKEPCVCDVKQARIPYVPGA